MGRRRRVGVFSGGIARGGFGQGTLWRGKAKTSLGHGTSQVLKAGKEELQLIVEGIAGGGMEGVDGGLLGQGWGKMSIVGGRCAGKPRLVIRHIQ